MENQRKLNVGHAKSQKTDFEVPVIQIHIFFSLPNSPGERDLPVLRQVLDGPQQLGEPLVVVVQRAQQRRRLRARGPRGRRRLRRRDGGQHRLGRRGGS